jgi:hypothetical protein
MVGRTSQLPQYIAELYVLRYVTASSAHSFSLRS